MSHFGCFELNLGRKPKGAIVSDGDDFGFEYSETHERFRFPKRPAPTKVYLCYAEWTWSPGSERAEHYWATLNRRTGRLLIWFKDTLMAGNGDKSVFAPYGSIALRKDDDIRSAAKRALAHGWAAEVADNGLDAPHSWSDGLLDTADMRQLISLVWPPHATVN